MTRKQALLIGERLYFTGKPCPRGHVVARYASTNACVECLKAAKAAYRSRPANVETERAGRARRYATDRSEILQRLRDIPEGARRQRMRAAAERWRSNNRERVRAYSRDYKKANPPANAARASHYNAAKLRATPAWADRQAITAVYAAAANLTRETGIRHEVDHVYPLRGRSVWGLHVSGNLAVVTASVNRRKYNKHPNDIVGYAKLVADRIAADDAGKRVVQLERRP